MAMYLGGLTFWLVRRVMRGLNSLGLVDFGTLAWVGISMPESKRVFIYRLIP